MIRLFIAVDIGDKVATYLSNELNDITDVRRCPASQLHITLCFIGDIQENELDCIKTALSQVKSQKFSCSTQNCGFFPNRRRPTVYWVGLSNHQDFSALRKQIDVELATTSSNSSKDKSFKPHLTLARIKKTTSKKSINYLEQIGKNLKKQYIYIDKFYLYSSTLTSTGAIHKVEAEYSLID